ncbi:MAG: 6-phosphogluconolactonase [Deltaproteobacteria bacterium]|nr:6-phosphogluconolactonase [Deltaproteobacteria bacterium]
MTIRVFPDLQELSAAAAQAVSDELIEAIFERGRATLALAGGNTPRQTYALLAETENIDWDKVEIYFTDERAIPPTHPDSNFQMACEELLELLPVQPAAVHRMEADQHQLGNAARQYEALLPEALDVLILGLGQDGHTASLFPDDPALYSADRVVAVQGPRPPFARLTITPRVIDTAKNVFVLATGAEKAEAVARALEGELDVATTPAQLARKGVWFLDEEAARELKERS